MSQTFRDGAPDAQPEKHGHRWRLYAVTFALSLLVYAATAQRGPAWQDSGIFQWRILQFDLFGWMGLALSHPLLIVLGKVFSYLPFGPGAWRVNLLSAVAGAVGVANVALLLRRLLGPRSWAPLAAGFLFFGHTLFWLATICESQALVLALFTTELHVLLSLVRRPGPEQTFLLGLVDGLASMAHNLALLALPVYGVLVLYLCAKRRCSWWSVAALAGGYVIGSGGMLAMLFVRATDVGLSAALSSALFGLRWQGQVLGGTPKAVVMGLGYVVYNFPNIALPLMIVGAVVLVRATGRIVALVFAYLTAVYFLFAVRYPVPDQFMFFLPFYAMVAVLAGIGLGRLTRGGRRRWLVVLTLASLLVTPVVYAAAPSVFRSLGLSLPGRSDLPYRDPYAYWLRPWKAGENSAGRFAAEALAAVPEKSVIIADSTSLYPLLWTKYQKFPGRSIRLLSVVQADPEAVPPGRERVFIVSRKEGRYPEWMRSQVAFVPVGRPRVLYRVVWEGDSDQPEDAEPR